MMSNVAVAVTATALSNHTKDTSTNTTNNAPSFVKNLNFPRRLFRFLQYLEVNNLSHIAGWQPRGRCFRVHKPNEFEKLNGPSWFVYTKYSSFQRQLNIYGFLRITSGSDKNYYFHKHFLRGQEHLLHRIIRMPMKKVTPSCSLHQSLSHSDEMTPKQGTESDSSRGGTNTTLSVFNSSHLMLENGNVNHVASLANDAGSIEIALRSVNQAIQSIVDEATTSHFDFLSNCQNIALPANIDLLLRMEQQNASSIHNTACDVSSILPRNTVNRVTELPTLRQALISQVQQEQWDQKTNHALSILAMMQQGNQIRALTEQSDVSVLPNLASHLLQNEQLHLTSNFGLESFSQSSLSHFVPVQHLSSSSEAIIMNERNKFLQDLWNRRNQDLQQHIRSRTDVSLFSPEIREYINRVVAVPPGSPVTGIDDGRDNQNSSCNY